MKIVLTSAFCLLLLCRVSVSAQDITGAMQQLDLPRFHLDALSFASDSSSHTKLSRLDLYVELPYEMLSFTKNTDAFRANYEITIDIYDTSGNLINEKLWTEKIETKNYDESISNHVGKISMESFTLAPGVYNVSVQVRDNETKKVSKRKRVVRVKDFSASPFCASDILLVNRTNKESDKIILIPNVSGNYSSAHEGFNIFFELYQKQPVDSALISLMVHTAKGDIVLRDSMIQRLTNSRTACVLNVKANSFPAGDYTLEVHALPIVAKTDSENKTTLSSRTFSIRLRGLPTAISDLDLAVEQLQYITERDKIDEMKKAVPEEKRRMFNEFWKKRDPTPKTEYNELMEEYYSRVDYANKNFSHYMEGWKTDRGMVYIIFGLPNNIERHPFDMDAKPYEVWTYYEINREFTFVDATGFGDYRLMNPIWDTWRTRYR